jgi:serine/threonine protein kinase
MSTFSDLANETLIKIAQNIHDCDLGSFMDVSHATQRAACSEGLDGEIDSENIIFKKSLGNSSYGYVKKGRLGNLDVVVKYFRCIDLEMAELKKLGSLFRNEHTIKIYGFTTEPPCKLNGIVIKNIYGFTTDSPCKVNGIVMKYYANGTLCDYLKSNFCQLTWNDKLKMAQDITDGLYFIHQQGYLHYHLHDGNIMIDDDGRALIMDFGINKHIKETHKQITHPERFVFTTLERHLNNTLPFTAQDDIYALGGILWELTSGRPQIYSYDGILLELTTGKRPSYKNYKECKRINGTPEWYHEIYTKCLAVDPDERPSLDYIKTELSWGQWNMDLD